MAETIQMPALSPTMEEGTLARWFVKEGDRFSRGDILAEIETDKATMELEAEEEGIISRIEIAAGTADVKVGAVIAAFVAADQAPPLHPSEAPVPDDPESEASTSAPPGENKTAGSDMADVKASPLAPRVAETKDVELGEVTGSGSSGAAFGDAQARAAMPADAGPPEGVPYETIALSSMRKTIARRLTEAKRQIPHIYLSMDIRLDKLLALRSEVNAGFEASCKRLSVNDFMIKALALALIEVPECNVQYAGDQLLKFHRADISVAVSIPGGLVTPVIAGAEAKGTAAISAEMKNLAERAKSGKLAPHEYQGGTASLSNMGMYGIRQFQAVINPPQAMIMAIGAGEPRPVVVDGAVAVATVMSATGSFDHRVIDGADGARLMQAFKSLVENPLRILA